ncbi:Gfo/Idh/MocA family oxidoreductase [Leifsonia shinshuensis]|uniref:Gfo/Idh/MocA family protein n=1 Tax=Leifsonia shinshuensis TaxID=150026 RepID=UPI001F5084D5|nr:Gfo/Idh/MocA family oxidoreductase [Leifsonia shinshuensis]MCI0157772.1 Gfo/Idh/MocA family oxidoreductase [Leifsonia shinshuensis]
MTAPSTTPIRVGLIGGGGIAGFHIGGYAGSADRIAITAVADAHAETAARRGAELGVPHYPGIQELLENEDVDAVDICLPHHLHRDAIITAAKAGKHILCEKPLCLTHEEAADVRSAVEEAGVVLMCAHNQLFLPPVAAARAIIDSGALGDVYEVRTADSFRSDMTPETMGWRSHASTAGGGELIDTGYHPAYLLLHLAGATPESAVAVLSTHRLRWMEGEDSAQVLYTFDNGVVGHLTTSWAYEPAPGAERFSVVGERGSLSSDGTSLAVALNGQPAETITFEAVDTFVAEIAHFADSVAAATRPLHSEKEGIEVLGMILAAYESSRTAAFASVR